MVFTLTLNPAIDYLLKSSKPIGNYQRLSDYDLIASGKGINVSLQLKNLGVDTLPIAVVGQATGLAYKDMIHKQFDNAVTFEANTLTRINVKINSAGRTLELNTTGRAVADYKFIDELCKYVSKNVRADDVFAIMGALPYKMPPAKLLPLLKAIQLKKARFLIDMRGAHVLKYGFMKPELIKPNLDELGEFFGTKPKTLKQITAQSHKLLDLGFKRVLVSMGKDGSLYFDKETTLKAEPYKLKEVNSAGAGDAMVAGFLTGMLSNANPEECLRLAAACASAKVASVWYGNKKMVSTMSKKITIRRIK